jgi:hypothetical protein
MFLMVLFLAFSRVQLNCHRPVQTLIGIIGGSIWGLVMYFIVETFVNNYPIIYQHKMAVLQIFDVEDNPDDESSDDNSNNSSNPSNQQTGPRWNSL